MEINNFISLHMYKSFPLWFPRYIVVKTHILIELIKYFRVHDDTIADEKYQFICMIDFRRVFRDGANVERINFRGGIVGNVKKKQKNTLVTLYAVWRKWFRWWLPGWYKAQNKITQSNTLPLSRRCGLGGGSFCIIFSITLSCRYNIWTCDILFDITCDILFDILTFLFL